MANSRKQSLRDERAVLQRRLKEIDAELLILDAEGLVADKQEKQHHPSAEMGRLRSGKKTLREIIISMLSDAKYMLSNTIVRQLYEAKYQKALSGSRLGTLSFDEQSRKNKWNTTVYGLTHPIQLVDGKIVQVKNIWARSDWSIERRINSPLTNTLVNLNFLGWYITVQDSRGYEYLKSPAMLRYVEGVLASLDLEPVISPPFDSTYAKKVIISEIENVRMKEEQDYSELKFKILSAHRQSKKDFDPELDGDTDFYA